VIRTWAHWVWGTTIKALHKSTSFTFYARNYVSGCPTVNQFQFPSPWNCLTENVEFIAFARWRYFITQLWWKQALHVWFSILNLLCSDLRYVKDGAIGHVVPSGALRTMRSVAYRTSINPRECKHGGARHTTLPDFGSVHSLVFFIYYGSQSIADDILFW